MRQDLSSKQSGHLSGLMDEWRLCLVVSAKGWWWMQSATVHQNVHNVLLNVTRSSRFCSVMDITLTKRRYIAKQVLRHQDKVLVIILIKSEHKNFYIVTKLSIRKFSLLIFRCYSVQLLYLENKSVLDWMCLRVVLSVLNITLGKCSVTISLDTTFPLRLNALSLSFHYRCSSWKLWKLTRVTILHLKINPK